MANIFVVIDCKKRKPVLVTSSAKKAAETLKSVNSGLKVEIWSDNAWYDVVYANSPHELDEYIRLEKEYIGRKQKKAEERNKRRKRYNIIN